MNYETLLQKRAEIGGNLSTALTQTPAKKEQAIGDDITDAALEASRLEEVLAAAADSLTEAQFIAFAGVTAATAVQWRKLKKGPPWCRVGLRVYYPRQMLAEWMRQRAAQQMAKNAAAAEASAVTL